MPLLLLFVHVIILTKPNRSGNLEQPIVNRPHSPVTTSTNHVRVQPRTILSLPLSIILLPHAIIDVAGNGSLQLTDTGNATTITFNYTPTLLTT